MLCVLGSGGRSDPTSRDSADALVALQAVEVDPSCSYCWAAMGDLYREKHEHDLATEAYIHAYIQTHTHTAHSTQHTHTQTHRHTHIDINIDIHIDLYVDIYIYI
jgi:hypothetical protein